jgi:hypothetical protein
MPDPHQRGARHRTLAGAVVGGGLGLAVELALLAGTQSHIAAQLSCSNQQPYGCLGLAIIAIVALQVLFLTLPWPLLHLAGVRPAWRPALLGVLAQIGIYVLNSTIVEPWHSKAFPVLLPAAIYALAAFATSSDIPRRWRFSAVAVILVGYPLIAGALTGFTFMPHAIMDRLHL